MTDEELREAAERLRASLSELTECVKPNDNANGEWSAMAAGDGSGWYLLGPRYASRSSRTVVGLIFLDSFPDESPARDERVAVSIAGIINQSRCLLELLPPAGGIPADIRRDAEHVAGCSEDWCHAAGEADLFDAVRRGQRVAVAWLKGNPPAGSDGMPFDAWSFVRDVLRRGAQIERDCDPNQGYERFSSMLDSVARGLADKLRPHLRANQ